MNDTAVATISPASTLADFNGDRKMLKDFLLKELKQGSDYGIIPGTGNKKVLYQPGAEKLAKYFGMRPEYQCLKEIEDWKEGFVYYKYKCTLHHIRSGLIVGDAERSCNSKESKYRMKTVYDIANTVKAMAQKRAIVAAVRTATMATDLFEDAEGDPDTAGSATRDDNPARNRLMMRLFASAADRGFDGDRLKSIVKAKFRVESTTDLTNEQMAQTIEALETTHRVVGRGNKPVKLMDEVTDPTVVKAAEIAEEVITEEQEKFVDSAMAKVQEEVEVEPMRDVKAEITAKIDKLRQNKK